MQEDLEIRNKPQILMIGGGMMFRDKAQAVEFFKNLDVDNLKNRNKAWKDWLAWSLEDHYEFLKMHKPTADNAEYYFWKIIFEKYFIKFNDQDLILVTHSLGAIFIMKYLVENNFLKKIKQLHLISPVVSNEFVPKNNNWDLATFAFDHTKISELTNCCEEIHIWHSTDDMMCAYKNTEYLKEEIPSASLHTFTNKGHFLQSTFWELFDVLRKDL